MTEPIDDVKEFKFAHPEKILTADEAIARAAVIVKQAPNDPHRAELMIAKALLAAWQEGATFGADESVTMASGIIQKAVVRSIGEYLQAKVNSEN